MLWDEMKNWRFLTKYKQDTLRPVLKTEHGGMAFVKMVRVAKNFMLLTVKVVYFVKLFDQTKDSLELKINVNLGWAFLLKHQNYIG